MKRNSEAPQAALLQRLMINYLTDVVNRYLIISNDVLNEQQCKLDIVMTADYSIHKHITDIYYVASN